MFYMQRHNQIVTFDITTYLKVSLKSIKIQNALREIYEIKEKCKRS